MNFLKLHSRFGLVSGILHIYVCILYAYWSHLKFSSMKGILFMCVGFGRHSEYQTKKLIDMSNLPKVACPKFKHPA